MRSLSLCSAISVWVNRVINRPANPLRVLFPRKGSGYQETPALCA